MEKKVARSIPHDELVAHDELKNASPWLKNIHAELKKEREENATKALPYDDVNTGQKVSYLAINLEGM